MRTLYKIWLVTWITFVDCLRNKALYGILVMGVVLFSANIIFTGMFSWEPGKVAVDMGLSTISFAGLIVIFFLCMPMLAGDFEKKTIYLILARPITRTHYVLGKFTGLGLVVLISSTILGICAACSISISTLAMGMPIANNFSWGMFTLSVFFQTFSLLVLLALAFLWTMLTSNQFTAMILTLMSYFIGQTMENVKNIITSTKLLSPDSLSLKAMEFASWIFPNLALFDIKTTIAHGLSLGFGEMTKIVLYGFFYASICLCLNVIIFQKREI